MLSKIEEVSLIARCVAGDSRAAFGRLVIAYEDEVRRFLLNLTIGDAALTDDLAQDTFLKAYLSIKSFKGLAKFRTWLYTIAYHEFLSHKRRQAEGRLDSSSAYIIDEYSHASATDASIDVATCLATLNDKERTVCLLFYLEDMPIAKIEQITQIPEGTIKVYLSRARAKMAQFIKNDETQ